MITIKLIQEYIDQDPDRIQIFYKKNPMKYPYYTVEEIISDTDCNDEIIIQVLASDGIRDHERLGLIDRSDFLTWVRDNKIRLLV